MNKKNTNHFADGLFVCLILFFVVFMAIELQQTARKNPAEFYWKNAVTSKPNLFT